MYFLGCLNAPPGQRRRASDAKRQGAGSAAGRDDGRVEQTKQKRGIFVIYAFDPLLSI